MEKKSVYGMTEGSPAKLLLSFTIPMLIGNLFQQFYRRKCTGSGRCDRFPEFPVFLHELWCICGRWCGTVTIFRSR